MAETFLLDILFKNDSTISSLANPNNVLQLIESAITSDKLYHELSILKKNNNTKESNIDEPNNTDDNNKTNESNNTDDPDVIDPETKIKQDIKMHNLICNTDEFRLPMMYHEGVCEVLPDIVDNLELTVSKDESNNRSIYEQLFDLKDNVYDNVINKMATSYTTNTLHLKDTAKSINLITDTTLFNTSNITLAKETYLKKMVENNDFHNNFGYLDLSYFLRWTNNFKSVNDLLSITNLMSPLIALCIPIFGIIIPFIMLKFKGYNITLSAYLTELGEYFKNNPILKLIKSIKDNGFSQRNYSQLLTGSFLVTFFYAIFYIYNTFNSMLNVVTYYKNFLKIHDYFKIIQNYLTNTIKDMDYFYEVTKYQYTYYFFHDNLTLHQNVLQTYLNRLNEIKPYTWFVSKLFEIGKVTHLFYNMYSDTNFQRAMNYSFEFNAYFNILKQLKIGINSNKLNFATFIDKNDTTTKPIINDAVYPKYVWDNNAVSLGKNTELTLDKHLIITGSNASGKTTTLKTLFINTLLSQQFGLGCYSKYVFKPYDYFHCYLNIPDTSNRDSLFQAEAKRCKMILESINNKKNKRHFCLFDELFTGTNPEEAIKCGKIFYSKIVKNDNVFSLLTTHFVKLCKIFEKDKYKKCVKNMKMHTDIINNELVHRYYIENGISEIKGGIKELTKVMNC